MKGDIIKNLPTDNSSLSKDEDYIYTNIFLKDLKEHKKNSKFGKFIQVFLLCMFLFILLNLPQVEDLIRNFLPIMNNNAFFIPFKSFVFTLVLFFFENLNLSKSE